MIEHKFDLLRTTLLGLSYQTRRSEEDFQKISGDLDRFHEFVFDFQWVVQKVYITYPNKILIIFLCLPMFNREC